ncbi:hypothetical protein VY88_33010 [Azospirillum thiophilum]|uniref:Uncharacterized protein n=1 Tax=Azospirillum thiophilum TaxID=528244 RepID=A0AAC8W5Y8_9PROT|nr:hypothetical protein [Azospirillum thiophilum]ALG75718.1 hypothetical protein AL072_32765 [Azospirillum thiophilum]KJR61220.1 hypothetical protein VY88_33010 [Azospirillum thiophilum]
MLWPPCRFTWSSSARHPPPLPAGFLAADAGLDGDVDTARALLVVAVVCAITAVAALDLDRTARLLGLIGIRRR